MHSIDQGHCQYGTKWKSIAIWLSKNCMQRWPDNVILLLSKPYSRKSHYALSVLILITVTHQSTILKYPASRGHLSLDSNQYRCHVALSMIYGAQRSPDVTQNRNVIKDHVCQWYEYTDYKMCQIWVHCAAVVLPPVINYFLSLNNLMTSLKRQKTF